MALWSIGPRQTTAALSSRKKPIDITLMPAGPLRGTIFRSALTSGFRLTPSMRGIE